MTADRKERQGYAACQARQGYAVRRRWSRRRPRRRRYPQARGRYTLRAPSPVRTPSYRPCEARRSWKLALESVPAPSRSGAAGTAFQHLDTAAAGRRGRRLRCGCSRRTATSSTGSTRTAARRIGELVGGSCRRRRREVVVEVGSRRARTRPTPAPAHGARSRARSASREAAVHRRPPEPGFHVRQLRRGQEQPARPRGRGAGRRESRPRLQPAVHLRRRRSRQDAPDARRRQPRSARATGRARRLRPLRALRRATWCARFSTTPSTSSRRRIARSMRC